MPLDLLFPEKVESVSQLACISVGRDCNAVALAPNVRRAALGLQDHTLQIWDVDTQVMLHVLRGHKYWVNHVAWSPDGVRVASASADKSVKVWTANDGYCECTLNGHLLSVAAVAFSQDSLRLASGSWDKTVCIWDIELGQALITLNGHTDWVHSVIWAPGSRMLASASSDHSVRVWGTTSGVVEQVLVGHLQTVTSVSFSRSGIFLASGSLDRTVRVWNVQEGTLAARMQQDCDEGSVHSVSFAPDSERIAVGCSDKYVKVWNFRSGECEGRFGGHEDSVLSVCVSPDGSRVFSCSHDKSLRVWKMPARRLAQLSNGLPLSPAGSVRAQGNAAQDLQHLQERLRSTEDTNQRLRRQLSEAQSELEEKSRRMWKREASTGTQERQMQSYRDFINTLGVEKDVRRDFRQIPTQPAGEAPWPADVPAPLAAPASAAMQSTVANLGAEFRQMPVASAGRSVNGSPRHPSPMGTSSGPGGMMAVMQLGPAGARRFGSGPPSALGFPALPAGVAGLGQAGAGPNVSGGGAEAVDGHGAFLALQRPAGWAPPSSSAALQRARPNGRSPLATTRPELPPHAALPMTRMHPAVRARQASSPDMRARSLSPMPGPMSAAGLRARSPMGPYPGSGQGFPGQNAYSGQQFWATAMAGVA